MLVSAVLTISPSQGLKMGAYTGRMVNAAFLRMLAEIAPELAEDLHGSGRLKPFTISSVMGIPPSKRGKVKVEGGGEYWIRFTSIERGLSDFILSHLISGLPPSIRLEKVEWEICGITVDPKEHPWANLTTFKELAERNLFGSEAPPSKIGLRFSSPTTFRSRGHNVPLPIPSLVFGSYWEKWNAFSNLYLDLDLRRFAEEEVAVSRFYLRSRAVPFQGALQVGYIGDCEFTVLAGSERLLRMMNLLADFSFYCGTGSKTTMGFGQTRRKA